MWISASVFCLFAISLPGGAAMASDQVGTITQVDGDVKLFTHPSKKLQEGAASKSGGSHALYEGEYYVVENAKVGARVEQGNIVRTAPGAKGRVVFENGDQLNVGPGSAMRVFWDKDSKDSKTRLDLAYGKVRGIVEKGGPRSKLQIRTKTATMGVRGTDFFIADGGKDGGTEVSIMRGSVQVQPKAAGAKPVEVKQGMSADIPPAPAPVAAPKTGEKVAAAPAPVQPAVELRKTTQEELVGIQKSSVIEKKAGAPAQEASPEVAKLEKAAVATTMKDIKVYDPKLYEKIQEQKLTSTDDINGQVVATLIKEAPKAPEKRKPYKSEIDNLEQGAYEKYFKIQE
jgi:hypothetical protein